MEDLDLGMVVAANEFPHGLRCMDCDRELPEGTRYTERLSGVSGESFVVELVCLACGLTA